MPAPSSFAMTLKGVADCLVTDGLLPLQTRRDMLSAIKRFSALCSRAPGEIIADPAVIRDLMTKAPWQLAGYSKASWANMRSLITRAMRFAGVKVDRQRRNYKLTVPWDVLLAPLDKRNRDELRRFAGWCSTMGTAPTDVTAQTFDRFLQYMEEQSTQRGPRERVHVARRVWNRVIAIDGSQYPAIPAPPLAAKRALRWCDFPASLQTEVAAYSIRATQTDVFDESHKAIKPVTLAGYLTRLRVMLTAAVGSGVPIDRFTSLDTVIDPAMIKSALEFILAGDELDDRFRQNLHGMVVAALNVSRFLAPDGARRSELRKLEKRVRFVAKGMNAKNKERLRVLMNPAARSKLLRLPLVVAKDMAQVTKSTVRQVQRMQMAVLLDILLHIPMRIKNAAELDMASTISCPVAGLDGKWRISIPANEVKNLVAVDGELGLATSELIKIYVTMFRPRLAKGPSTRLFLGQTGKGKGPSALSKQLARFVKRETGIVIHAHLFRHLAAHLYLMANPGHYEAVRQLLGHKNIETTIRFYSGLETGQAFAAYDELMEQLQAGGGS